MANGQSVTAQQKHPPQHLHLVPPKRTRWNPVTALRDRGQLLINDARRSKALGVCYAYGVIGAVDAITSRFAGTIDPLGGGFLTEVVADFGLHGSALHAGLRMALGGAQIVATGVTIARVFYKDMPAKGAMIYLTVSAFSHFLQQSMSANTATPFFDVASAAAAHIAWDPVIFGTLALRDRIYSRFGSVPFTEWTATQRDKSWWKPGHVAVAVGDGFAALAPCAAAFLSPERVATLASALLIAGLFIGGGVAAQAVFSVANVEGADLGESTEQTFLRRTLAAPFEVWFQGYGAGLVFAVADNLLFVGSNAVTLDYFSYYDGQPIAIDQARRALRDADSADDVQSVLLQAPWTNKSILGDADYDLATKTWTAIASATVAQEFANAAFAQYLFGAMQRLLHSEALHERRVGIAAGVVLHQLTKASGGQPWANTIDQQLTELPFLAVPNVTLTTARLQQIFHNIDAGFYDDQHLVVLPRGESLPTARTVIPSVQRQSH